MYFQPNRIPGCHVSVHIQTRTTYTKVLNFFRLLFTVQLGDSTETHTNSYAWAYISKKKVMQTRKVHGVKQIQKKL